MQRKAEKISVIMPAYNAQKTVGRAVESVLKQDWPDFELIVIDDGSTDHTVRVCRQADPDPASGRLRILTQPNAGPAAARNRGLQEAEGDLLCFVDADDAVREGFLRVLAESIRGAQMAVCGYCIVEENTRREISPPIPPENTGRASGDAPPEASVPYARREKDGQKAEAAPASAGAMAVTGPLRTETASEAMKMVLTEEWAGGYLWNKIFRRDIVEKNRLRFHDGVYVGEDLLFVEQYLSHCDTVNPAGQVLYDYTCLAASISHSLNRKNLTLLDALERILLLSDETGFRKAVTNRYVRQFLAFAALFPERECPRKRLDAFLKKAGIPGRQVFARLTPDYKARYLMFRISRKMYAKIIAAHKKS